jgi:hypothetical protein
VAAADLAALWEIFTGYAAVVDRAAELLASGRRLGSAELAEITTMLNGPSVVLTRAPMPLSRRDLTDRGRSALTLAAALAEMKRSFASVTEVTAAAESVWNEAADGLIEIGSALDPAKEQAAGLNDVAVTEALAAAGAELGRLREVLNADPLALWQHGRIDTGRLQRLRTQAAAAVARAGELARVRADAQRRIAAARAAIAAVAAARQDAVTARERAAARIAVLPPPPAETGGLDVRAATLDTLQATGRWTRLAAELDAIETEAAAAAERYRAAERAATALLGRREELRGLLDAYQAKAGRLGGAEDADLTARYQLARDLLWTAPCDLAAASAAVRDYQQAILALDGRGQPR